MYGQIDKYLKETHFNGTVAIFDNGKLKMNKGYGYKDIEKVRKILLIQCILLVLLKNSQRINA